MTSLRRTLTSLPLVLFCCTLGFAHRAWAQSECTANVFLCSQGPRSGLTCCNDDECAPGGACVIAQGVCNGGTTDGQYCDCAGGTCGAAGTCIGGSAAGLSCSTDDNCGGGAACVGAFKVCLGGDNQGVSCLNNGQCPGSTCAATGRFCIDSICFGGSKDGQTCGADSDCTGGGICRPDFPGFSCTTDDDCCADPSSCEPDICVTPVPADTPTRTPANATATRTPTRPTPTRTTPGAATGTPTATQPVATPPTSTATAAIVTSTPVPALTATKTPTPPQGPSAHLVQAISSNAQSLTLDDASAFPGTCGRVQIDNEQLSYIGKSGNTLTTLQHGLNGTVPTGHSANAVVTYLVPTGPVTCQIVAEGGGGCSLAPPGRRDTAPFVLLAVAVAARRLRPRRRPGQSKATAS